MTRSLAALMGLILSAVARPASAARELPTVDASTRTPLPFHVPSARKRAPSAAQGVHVAHEEPRLGVPTFVWGDRSAAGARRLRPVSPEQAAREALGQNAELYRLSRTDAAHLPLSRLDRTSAGAHLITFTQEVDGIQVFRQSLKVLLDANQQLVAMSGHLSPVASSPRLAGGVLPFTLSPREAIAQAWRDLHGQALPPESLLSTGKDHGPYSRYELSPGPRLVVLASPARTRKVFFPLPGKLVPAYYVELDTTPVTETEGELYAYVISAEDGTLLYRHNLSAHQSYTYRVWADAESPFIPFDGPQGNAATPHPTGLPDGYQAPFVSPNRVTLQNSPFSRNDPWLPEGATQTTGNNVEAYADIVSPNGFTAGDVRASTSAPGTFDHAYDLMLPPSITETQQMSAVTQLFFVNNFLHDWYYDAGFDEASGNAQMKNFDRGGLEADSLRVEGQDYGGRNNANMSTPADGERPRMQMFVYDTRGRRVVILPPGHPLEGARTFGTSAFGPQQFDVTAALVLAQDGIAGASGGTVSDACEPLTNAAEVAGKVVLVDQPGCAYTVKAAQAQAAGALGVIIANATPNGGTFAILGRAPDITLPVVSVNNQVGLQLRAQPPESLQLVRDATDRDGTLDNTIIAHEWMHYMSNRLVGDANGLTNNQGRSMGEGWGDFSGLMMVVRPGDDQVPSNAGFGGVYGRGSYVNSGGTNQGFYWGSRRYPYSTDLTKNPLTLRHIQDGVALPEGIPVNFGQDGANNSEVHASGEVWANMLWECYASLLRDKDRLTFAQAQQRMKEYLVTSLKLTPNAPTFLEARDALLAAAYAHDRADFALFARAFARRGAGTRAVVPARDSEDHVGVTESFTVGKDVALVSAEIIEQPGSLASCDDDGVLDTGETALVRVTLRNAGVADLSKTSMTLSSSDPDISFSAGASVSFPGSEPFQSVIKELPVKLSGASTRRKLSLTVAYRDEEQMTPGDQTHTVPLRVNTDEVPGSSIEETVEAAHHPWLLPVPEGSDRGWARQTDVAGTTWFFHGPNNNVPTNAYLVSPPLQVAAEGGFRFTFQHRYSFETDGTSFYDGGIIELSEDDGATWVDIGDSVSPAYNAVIDNRWGNPLAGKPAYGGESAEYPAFTQATVSLGTTYAGKTVRIRFRIATDDGTSAPGWDVDDLQFEGLANTPFASVVEHRGQCLNRAPVANAGTEQTVNERRRVTLSGSGTDPENGALTYAWTQTAGPGVELSDASTQSPTFRAPEVTEETELRFELRVSDGQSTSEPSPVTVRVRNISDGNRAPVATVQPVAAVTEGVDVTLTGGGSDPDEDAPLTFAWRQVGGPAVTLSNAASPQTGFTAPMVNEDTTLTFELQVTDPDGRSSAATVTVGVTNERDPLPPPGSDSGCGCASGQDGSVPAITALLLAVLGVMVRRPRTQPARLPKR